MTRKQIEWRIWANLQDKLRLDENFDRCRDETHRQTIAQHIHEIEVEVADLRKMLAEKTIVRECKVFTVDGLGQYVGYGNMEFYHRGYAPYFDKETCFRIMEDYLTAYKKYVAENEVGMGYCASADVFFHFDPNGDISELWRGEDVETVDGIKHLYPFGAEWMWDTVGNED